MQAYEFTDTLIMIMKKNKRQITFLCVAGCASWAWRSLQCWTLAERAMPSLQACLPPLHCGLPLLVGRRELRARGRRLLHLRPEFLCACAHVSISFCAYLSLVVWPLLLGDAQDLHRQCFRVRGRWPGCRYGYYLAAASGIKVPKALKQGVTIVQLTQFALFLTHSMYGLVVATDYRPRIVVVLCIFQAIVFAALFGHFFWCDCEDLHSHKHAAQPGPLCMPKGGCYAAGTPT